MMADAAAGVVGAFRFLCSLLLRGMQAWVRVCGELAPAKMLLQWRVLHDGSQLFRIEKGDMF